MDERKAAVELLQSAREHLKEHLDECGLWQAINHVLCSSELSSATDKALWIANEDDEPSSHPTGPVKRLKRFAISLLAGLCSKRPNARDATFSMTQSSTRSA